MKLQTLAVNQFKKFTVPMRLDNIGHGLNVVVGPNEMGKSTLLDALRAVLFEKHSSKAQSITQLQNDRNQAGPVVELAFELDEGLYRITKRFIKKPYARLACPDGRMLEGDAAEDKLRSLLGFEEPGKTGAKPETLGMWNVLWVQQGQSFGALELPESARSSLRSALEAEVGAVLGGRRGRALPLAIEGQLSDIVTSGGKPRGKYKDLVDRTASLQTEVEELRSRRQELSQTLDELENAQTILSRLSSGDRDTADQNEISEARRRHTQLAELEARITAAGTLQELKSRNLAQAKQALGDREKLRATIADHEATENAAQVRRAEALREEEAARSRLSQLRGAVSTAEGLLTKAGETVTAQRRTLQAVQRQANIRELEGRCEKARDAEKRHGEAREAAATILVTREALDEIRNAAKALETVTGRLSAAATVVTFEMNHDQWDTIKIGEKPVEPQHPSLKVVEPTTITIPGRGRITIEPAIKDRDKLLAHQREAQTKLNNALSAAGATTPAGAEAQYEKRQDFLRQVEICRQEVELHAPKTAEQEAGVAPLAAVIEGLRRVLAREMTELGVDVLPGRQEAEDGLRAAEQEAQQTQSALATARAALTGRDERLSQLQTELGEVNARYADAQERLGQLRLQLVEYEAVFSDKRLQQDVTSATTALNEQETAVANLEEQRRGETLSQLDIRISRLEGAIRDRQEKRGKLNEKIAGLRSTIEAFEGVGLDETIAKKGRELELCREECSRCEREVRVLGLLLGTLRSAEQEAKERYLSPVLNRLRPYLEFLFPGAALTLDENLQIVGVLRDGGYEEAFERLSVGTQEQIAVLVRLAFAEMLVEQGHPATVILDDALVFSDDRRMSRMFDILSTAARTVQILVFTCREQLFEGLGGRPLALEAAGREELASA